MKCKSDLTSVSKVTAPKQRKNEWDLRFWGVGETERMTTTQDVGSLLGWHVLLYNTDSRALPLGQFQPAMI